LGIALREKFKTPGDALKALGLDESLIKASTENLMSKPTRFAANTLLLTAGYLAPLLAKDAKIDLMPIFKDVTRKSFKAKPITMALDGALKGKLAKDADISHVAEMLDHLERAKPEEGADEAASEPEKKAMEKAAAAGDAEEDDDKDKAYDAEPFKAFLKEKGVNDEDIAKAMDMMPKSGAADADETEEEKKAREAKAAKDEEIKTEAEKKANDAKTARDKEMEERPTKAAMDAALKATVKQVRDNERGIRVAIADVHPWVGDLSPTLALDSADDVYRHAATMLNLPDAKTIHASALPTLIKLMPKPGARPVEGGHTSIAMDAAASDDFASRFADAARIGTA
jgi:chemotaxis protein histidine kinase CheA